MTNKKSNLLTIGRRGQKILVGLLTLTAVVGIYASVYAYNQPAYAAGTSRYVWENIGVLCIVIEFVLALVLVKAQQYTYWFSWLRLAKIDFDERQMLWRQRVFEKAYGLALLLALLGAVAIEQATPSLAADEHHTLVVKLAWLFGIYFLSLPSVLGAWQNKNTRS